MASKIISYRTHLSIPQFEAVTIALAKTSEINNRVILLPIYSPSNSYYHALQVGVVDATLIFERNPVANGESDLVSCKLIAPDKKAYREAKFLLEALGPSDSLSTEEVHDW